MVPKVVAVLCLALAAAAVSVSVAAPAPPAGAATPRLKIVFAALDRGPAGNTVGLQALYVANGDGTSIARLTPPDDGKYYDWPMWGMNGTKVLFTARDGEAAGGAEPIYMMDVQRSEMTQLTYNRWRNGQPKPSPDGKSVLFTSFWKEFPVVALYRLLLATGEVENLSAQYATDSGFDSDPFWTADGKGIVFASTRDADGKEQPTQIYTMNADGADRRRLTDDRYFNTDPSLSPDGRYLTTSSYRGEGHPALEGAEGDFTKMRLHSWPLVIKDTVTGTERVLTAGKDCGMRDFWNPCTPTEGSAWVPKWSPDGRQVGFISILGPDRSGIYVIDADGSNARPIIETADKAITWFDWTWDTPADATPGMTPPPASTGLLFGGPVHGQLAEGAGPPPSQLFVSSPDRWFAAPVALSRDDLAPSLARWSADKQHIVFTSPTAVERSTPDLSATAGLDRHSRLRSAALLDESEEGRSTVAEQQVFLMASDGASLRQMTTPRTEDALDPIPEGELRGNTDPDLSPDGRYLVFTNRSEATMEAWILRLDLQTGEVINLSSVTRGPFPGTDERPRFSPDSSQIAFASWVEDAAQVFVMATDGQNVRQLTNDPHQNLDPAWSPDGRWLVYTSERTAAASSADAEPRKEWYLVKLDVQTGEQTVLAGGKGFEPRRPVWSPDGWRIAFVAVTHGLQPDIYIIDADGSHLRPLQVTLRTKELFVDWR